MRRKEYTRLTYEEALNLQPGDEIKYASLEIYRDKNGGLFKVDRVVKSKKQENVVIIFAEGFEKGILHHRFSYYKQPKLEDFV